MPTVPARTASLTFPPFDLLNHEASALRAAGHDVISLGQAVPGFGPPPAAIEAARRALGDPKAHRYSADAGIATLREALCEKLSTHRGARVSLDEVIITAGGNQAFMLAAMTLIDPGDEVLMVSPYFVNHDMAIRALGGVPIEAPVVEADAFTPRWSAIEPRVTTRTRAVVICSPSNPTGAVIDGHELPTIVDELRSRGVLVFSDETYQHFGNAAPSAASIEAWRDHVVVVGTFSKSFGMTGWRVGYMIADAALCQQALKIQDAMIICAPTISQIAAEAAIRDDWNYAHRFDAELADRREALAEGISSIPRLHWTRTPGGFFAFVRVEGCEDSMTLALDVLHRAHVVTIPGATFGRSGEGFLRLSYGAASVEDLQEALRRLRGYFG